MASALPARVDRPGSGPALVTPWKVLEWDTDVLEEAAQGRVLQADLETSPGGPRVQCPLQSRTSAADYDAVEEAEARGAEVVAVTRASGPGRCRLRSCAAAWKKALIQWCWLGISTTRPCRTHPVNCGKAP